MSGILYSEMRRGDTVDGRRFSINSGGLVDIDNDDNDGVLGRIYLFDQW